MSTDIEIEGRAFIVVLAGRAGPLVALADHATASAVPPQVGDALDDVVRGLRRAVEAARQALNAEARRTDPWVRCLPKILAEVTASHQGFVAVLTTWETSWWTRCLDDLPQGNRAFREFEVESEVGHGAR